VIADDNFLVWAWRELRGKRPHIVLRLTATVVSGLALLAASLIGSWTWAHCLGRGFVREAELESAVIMGAAIWLAALVRIWKNTRTALHVIWTGALVAAVIGLSFVVEEVWHVRDSEFFILAFILLGLAGVILVWLPVLMRGVRHRPVIDTQDIVRVNCPECGYLLVGLRDLRCPECGTQFTLDELIRAQNYGGTQPGAECAGTADLAELNGVPKGAKPAAAPHKRGDRRDD
jgi:hypothetical protein